MTPDATPTVIIPDETEEPQAATTVAAPTPAQRKLLRRGRFLALVSGGLLCASIVFPWVEVQSAPVGVGIDVGFHQGFFVFWAVFGAAGAFTLALSRFWKWAPLFALLFPLPALVYATLAFLDWGGGVGTRLVPGLGAILGGLGALLAIGAGFKALARLRKHAR